MILVNGEVRQNIDVFDRGFQYGDGLFETIEVDNGRPVFLDRHFSRLEHGCRRLKIPCPDLNLLTAEATRLSDSVVRAVLKIIVTRGAGGRGYRQPDSVWPTRVVSLHPFPDYPEVFEREGICARFCLTRLGLNPALAGIKHLNRLEQVMARAEWNDPAIQEGLMLDLDGHVIEGTMTNLFYIRDGRLHTSPVSAAGIAGITRSVIIELADLHRLELAQHYFDTCELLAAEEIFVCNSVIGLWPIIRLANQTFTVGPVTLKISQWLADYKQQWLCRC